MRSKLKRASAAIWPAAAQIAPDLAAEGGERVFDATGAFVTPGFIDCHTHFLRDDTRLAGFAQMRSTVAARGWNPQLSAAGLQTVEDVHGHQG